MSEQDESERMPPHDVIAEQCALGGMMLSRAAAEDVLGILQPGDYYRPAHGLIHESVESLAAAGNPCDAVAVAADLVRRGHIGQMGGAPYLHTLIQRVPTAANAAYYARIVRERAIMRRLVEAGTRIAQMGYAADGDAAEIADRAEAELAAVLPATESGTASDSAELFADAAERYVNPPTVAGLITVPWEDLRELIPYLRRGELITVGAVPGTGKSVVAADLLRHIGLHIGLRVILYTLEMGRAEVMDRIVAAETKVPLRHFQDYAVDDLDLHRIALAGERFGDGMFVIDDSPRTSVATIRADLRARARTDPARAIIVDYLQLLKAGSGRPESREREVAANTDALKAIAREFRIPVVMLAQLNRNAATRPDKKPTKSDLRESGAIENDSDVVLLIHRPDMYDPDSTRPGEADLIVDKNRSGALGVRTVLFQGEYGRFAAYSRAPYGTSGYADEVAS